MILLMGLRNRRKRNMIVPARHIRNLKIAKLQDNIRRKTRIRNIVRNINNIKSTRNIKNIRNIGKKIKIKNAV